MDRKKRRAIGTAVRGFVLAAAVVLSSALTLPLARATTDTSPRKTTSPSKGTGVTPSALALRAQEGNMWMPSSLAAVEASLRRFEPGSSCAVDDMQLSSTSLFLRLSESGGVPFMLVLSPFQSEERGQARYSGSITSRHSRLFGTGYVHYRVTSIGSRSDPRSPGHSSLLKTELDVNVDENAHQVTSLRVRQFALRESLGFASWNELPAFRCP